MYDNMSDGAGTENKGATNQQTQPGSQSTEGGAGTQQASQGTQGTQGASQGQGQEGQGQPTNQGGVNQGSADGGQGQPASKGEQGDQSATEYNFVPPEGKEYDKAIIEKYSEVAKELKLPQESADKLLRTMTEAIEARTVERITQATAARVDEWKTSAYEDKEFGGDKYDENIGVAIGALKQFTTPELQAMLRETGLQHHPEIIRTFYRVGRAVSEDKHVFGNENAGPRDPAKIMFPNQS